MIIIEVMGGLGNQLQQYALYQKMKSLGKEVKLDISWFEDEKRQADVLASRKLELRYFENLPMEVCTAGEKERLIGKDNLLGKMKRKLLPGTDKHFFESDMYHPEIFDFEDRYLTGFWACEKYYADILPQLRKIIVFPIQKENKNVQTILTEDKEDNKCTEKTNFRDSSEKRENNIKNQNCKKEKQNETEIQTTDKTVDRNIYYHECIEKRSNRQKSSAIQNITTKELNFQTMEQMKNEVSVSIHIRRGDYLDKENAAMFGGICTEQYYETAIAYILDKCPNAHFYIFSDDTAYAKENYQGPQYTIVDWNTGADSFYDIQLMSSCRHNICANSTFSFWGARLNPNPDKIMVRPAKHKNSQQIIPEKMHELWNNWVLIDGNGRIV